MFCVLSCIMQTLWDLCECQYIIEATVPLLSFGCKVEEKHLLKMVTDVKLLMA